MHSVLDRRLVSVDLDRHMRQVVQNWRIWQQSGGNTPVRT